jgi:hypothetical protein
MADSGVVVARVAAFANARAAGRPTKRCFALTKFVPYRRRGALGCVRCVHVSRAALAAAASRGDLRIRPTVNRRFGFVAERAVPDVPLLLAGDQILCLEGESVRGDDRASLKRRWSALCTALGSFRTVRLRVYRPPRNPGDQRRLHAVASSGDVGFSVSRAAMDAATGTTDARLRAHLDGRSLWSDEHLAQQQKKLDDLRGAAAAPGDENLARLEAAVQAQADLRRVTQVGKQIRALQDTPADPEAPAHAAAAAALTLAFAEISLVIRMHYRPSRVEALADAARRRRRFLDRVVEETVAFATPTPAGSSRPGVVVVGDWVLARNKRGAKFPFKKYLDALARRAIVIVASERLTSAACAHCGSYVAHTRKQDSAQKSAGVSYCPNKSCPGKGLFFNRDLSAATAISHLFFHTMFWGGHGGKAAHVSGFCVAARSGNTFISIARYSKNKTKKTTHPPPPHRLVQRNGHAGSGRRLARARPPRPVLPHLRDAAGGAHPGRQA